MYDPNACAYDTPCAQCIHPVCANHGQTPELAGFQGFWCESTGEPVIPAACVACARAGAKPGCHQSAPVLLGVLAGLRPLDFGLTVTTLLGCARKARLMQTEPYWLKPSEAWWAFRGQMLHGVSAAHAQTLAPSVAETRFSMLVNDVEISGQPDLVLLDRAHLVDYKTTASVPGPWRTWTCPTKQVVIREGAFAVRTKWLECAACGERHETATIETHSPPRPYARHQQQLALYRLLLWENGIDARSAEIIYQDMRQQVRVPVELMPLDDTRALLEARLALHTQPSLPEPLQAPDDVWQCDYCPVRAACERLSQSA